MNEKTFIYVIFGALALGAVSVLFIAVPWSLH